MNCGFVKDRSKKVLLPRKHMAEQFYQLRPRFEDRLKVFRAQSQEQARADGRESFTRSRTGQERYFTEGVAGSDPSQFEFSTVLYLMRGLNNAVENELDRLRFHSLH